MEAAVNYFSKLLKVNPIIGNNFFPSGTSTDCLGVIVPSDAIISGIPNSDLHLYVIVKEDESAGDLANAVACCYSRTYKRPNFGRVEFNLAYVGRNTDPESFENDLETTVHEIIHVLGFSGYAMQFWIDPETGDFYGRQNLYKITRQITLRGLKMNILYSKNVLETGRKYYNCPTMEGMQLENEGGGGSLGSHWEQLLVQNEMMMSQDVITDAQLSVHTIALLKDTGYYTEVNENMADNLYWGKGKGCEFVEKGCYSKQEFPEFPKQYQQIEQQCSFENDGYGIPRTTEFMDKCLMKSVSKVSLCTSSALNSSLQAKQRLETYGMQSKCFTSTASSDLNNHYDKQRCHQFKCANDFSYIEISIPQLNKTLVCKKPNQILQVDSLSSKNGEITCPDNFQQFCDYVPICPNFCGAHGVCVRGTCLCNNGWSGPDCSTNCNQLIENGRCVPRCSPQNYENPDKSCQQSCPQGYFAARNGKCQQCNPECRQCTSSSDNCTACQFLAYLSGNKCISELSTNTSAPTAGSFCDSNCRKCENNVCQKCKVGFNLHLNQCIDQCPLGFKPDDDRKCQKQKLGRQRSKINENQQENNKCEQDGCIQCPQNKCKKCDQKKNFVLLRGNCIQCKVGTIAKNNRCINSRPGTV